MKFDIWEFKKICQKIEISLKSYNNNGNFTQKPLYIILYYLAEFFLEWGMFQAKFVEKIKTRVMFNRFFPKILPFVI